MLTNRPFLLQFHERKKVPTLIKGDLQGTRLSEFRRFEVLIIEIADGIIVVKSAPLLRHTQRLIGSHAGIKLADYRNGQLNEADEERLAKGFDTLRKAPIVIDAEMQNGLGQVRAKARRMSIEHGLDLLIVGYYPEPCKFIR